MAKFDASKFDARREECSQSTRNVLDFLKTVAEHAGSEVAAPTFEVRGIGITYWSRGKRFCRFDPKQHADHVWAGLQRLPGLSAQRPDGAACELGQRQQPQQRPWRKRAQAHEDEARFSVES